MSLSKPPITILVTYFSLANTATVPTENMRKYLPQPNFCNFANVSSQCIFNTARRIKSSLYQCVNFSHSVQEKNFTILRRNSPIARKSLCVGTENSRDF